MLRRTAVARDLAALGAAEVRLQNGVGTSLACRAGEIVAPSLVVLRHRDAMEVHVVAALACRAGGRSGTHDWASGAVRASVLS